MENFKGILAGVDANDLQMLGRAVRPLNNKGVNWDAIKDLNYLNYPFGYETPIHLTTKKKKKYRSIDEPFEPSW